MAEEMQPPAPVEAEAPVVAVPEDDGARDVPAADAAKAGNDIDGRELDEERKEADRRSRSPGRRDRRRRSRSRSRDRYRRRSRSRSRDRHHRRRSRTRSRSRDRRRHRDRQDRRRSPEGERYRSNRRRYSSPDQARMATVEDPFAKLRSAAATALNPADVARQMQEQQLRARQLVLQQQAASAVAAASKTQREVYVGNLAAGLVTDAMLHQLFSTTMATAFPDKCQGADPVVKVSVAPEGKYAFVELRSSDMSSACLQLSGNVSLMGQTLSIGRPAGYVDPGKASAAAQTAAEALTKFQAESQQARREAGLISDESMALEETPFLCIDGMITPQVLEDDTEFAEVLADLREEFDLHGTVLRVEVPRPPLELRASVAELMGTGPYGKAFVQFLDAEGAKAGRAAVEGRLFAGQRVSVTHLQPQAFMEAVGQTA